MTAIMTAAQGDRLARELGGKLTEVAHSSPSQMNTDSDCSRKHFFNKRMGITTPTHPAAALGSRTHDVLDTRLATLKWPTDPALQREVEIGRGGFGYLPANIDTLAKSIESEMRLEISALPIIGRVDLLLESLRLIIDHKTTSSRRWAKSPTQLLKDAQSIVYSMWAKLVLGWAHPIRFQHVGYITRGQPGGFCNEVQWRQEALLAAWDRIDAQVRRMYANTRGFDPGAVEPNWDSCSKYGGCPFTAQCAKVSRAGTSKTGGLDMLMEDTLLAGLSKKKKKDAKAEKEQFGKIAKLPPKGAVAPGSLPPATSPEGSMAEVLKEAPAAAPALLTQMSIPPAAPAPAEEKTPDPGAVNPPDAPKTVKRTRKATTRKPTGTLYIGCVPVGQKVVTLEEITAPLLAGIAEEKGKAHYLAVEFGKWKGPFSAALVGWLDANPLPKALVIMPHAPCASVAAEVLRPRFPNVVERLG